MKSKGMLDDLLRVFSDPVVLYPRAGVDVLSNDLRDEIRTERMLQLLKIPYSGHVKKATDAEALAYLVSASLEVPLSQDWSRIYAHLFGQYMEQKNLKIPRELESLVAECKELDEYYASLLSDLETWIQEQKDKHYKERQKAKPVREQSTDEFKINFDRLLQDL